MIGGKALKKEIYLDAELEIIHLGAHDVVRTSGPDSTDTDWGGGVWQ